jgi:hypothetical protein
MNTEQTQFEKQLAKQQAVERMQNAVNTLQRSMYEIERYKEDLEQSDNPEQQAKILNWAINHLVCNISPNLRIDLLADSQAELNRLAAK